jgi:hypothetical protein
MLTRRGFAGVALCACLTATGAAAQSTQNPLVGT